MKIKRLQPAGVTIMTLLYASRSLAGSSYVLPDGTNRAPAVVLHCVGSNGNAVPCGILTNPIVVSAPLGGPSSTNQLLQISSAQASAQALGTTADGAFTGGAGSVVSLLKGLWGTTSSGVPALAVGGTLVSRSTMLAAGISTNVFPLNPSRHYLSFQVPQSSGVWINLIGGIAAPNTIDCAYFAAGTFYESGSFINRGALTVYAPVSVTFSAWEN